MFKLLFARAGSAPGLLRDQHQPRASAAYNRGAYSGQRAKFRREGTLTDSASLPYVRRMAVATLTSKGQITLPAEIREKLQLVPGSKVVFEEQPNGDFVVRKKWRSISDLKGCLKAPPGFAPTLEDFEAAITEELRERDARSRQ